MLAEYPPDVDGASALAADDGFVYASGGRAVWRMPTAGGPWSRLGEVTGLLQLAVDDNHLYWRTGGYLFRMQKGGGTRETVFEGDGLSIFAMDADRIYLAAAGGVWSIAKLAGGGRVRIASGEPSLGSLAIDATAVYWLAGGELRKAPREGGPVRVVVGGLQPGWWVGADDTHLFWATGQGISRARKDGTEIRLLSPRTPGQPALAGGHVYAVAGPVYRMSKEGGTWSVLAYADGFDDDDFSTVFALNDTAVYWHPVQLRKVCK